MKKALLMGMILVGTWAGLLAGSSETIKETFNLAPGGTVQLDNVNGNITITAWDRDQVEMIAVKKATGIGAQKKMDEVQIELEEKSDLISIKTVHPKRKWMNSGNVSVTYELKVPARANLDLENTNGWIRVTDVEGNVAARTTNGKIRLEEIRGTIHARTTNGGISAELLEHNGEEISCKTTNGSIRLTLPADIQADITAKTTNGSIKTDLPLTLRGTIKRTRISAGINGGGTPIELRTTNGSINLMASSS